MPPIVLVSLIAWIAPGAILGRYVAQEKGRDLTEGLILGAIFGLFGVLIEALLPTRPVR